MKNCVYCGAQDIYDVCSECQGEAMNTASGDTE